MENPVGRLFDALMLQLEKNRVAFKAGAPYLFPFGPKELLNMVGLSSAEGNLFIKELFKAPGVKLVENKISVNDVMEVENQTKYFRKMDRLSKNRADARASR